MATKKQIEKKKKSRELKAKARVAARRHKLGQIKKEEKQSARLSKKFRDKIKPIVKDPEAKKKLEEIEAKKTLEKLEKNMQVLKALEEEYIKEKEAKKQLNEELEAEGYSTLKEKMKALEDRAKASMTPEEAETGMIDASSRKND